VIPVIGYDRWEDEEYATVLRQISKNINKFVIRLDSFAFDDMIEEEPFFDTIDDVLASMDIDVENCSVLLDFDDVTKMSILDIQENTQRAIDILDSYDFKFISIAGCSVSGDINGMVPEINTDGVVIRKEFKVWKTIRKFNPNVRFIFGDYGIANPQLSDDLIAPDANGKIRYTIEDSYFVVRGYSRRQGDKGAQVYGLCRRLINSGHYMGPSFSWGDFKINECAQEQFLGNSTNWVSIDTSHHMTYVLAEVKEFEKKIVEEKT
ncbi:beta family protein, partial [Salmonella enterica subsp. enterica serovar Kentucky]|nr:beta family protein [Salmonella enterica subsp. enterica serovar Kentucky]